MICTVSERVFEGGLDGGFEAKRAKFGGHCAAYCGEGSDGRVDVKI
jgi:hypothetical protein